MNKDILLLNSGCYVIYNALNTAFAQKDVLSKILGIKIDNNSSSYNFSEFGPIKVLTDMPNNISLILEPNRVRFEAINGVKLTESLINKYLIKLIRYIEKEQKCLIQSVGCTGSMQIKIPKEESFRLLLGTAFEKQKHGIKGYGSAFKFEDDIFSLDFNITAQNIEEDIAIASANVVYKEEYKKTDNLYKKYNTALDYIKETTNNLLF